MGFSPISESELEYGEAAAAEPRALRVRVGIRVIANYHRNSCRRKEAGGPLPSE